MKTDTQTLRIRPVAGRVVRDPDLHDLITAPRTVPDTPFWRRRIRDGDVTPDPSPPSAPEPAAQTAGVSAHADATAASSAKATVKRVTEGGTT